MPTATSARAEMLAGAKAVAPMLVGVIPFGLVAGAAPVTGGLGGEVSVGMSTILFAGASQLAATDVLVDGGTALVAIIAACTINLRMLLYSASLAPFLPHVPLRRRMLMAYLLTDQAYAMAVTRWSDEDPTAWRSPDEPEVEARVPYYLGAAILLWVNWQIVTVIGVLIGNAVPESLPLDFAVPLVFLVLLVPAVTGRPAVVAAVVGGAAAVTSLELGADHISILVGALAGIASGALAEAALEGRTARDDTPLAPDEGPTL